MIDRSHTVRGTINQAGVLHPFFVEEALPGDTFTLRQAVYVRLATLLRPLMDNLYVDTHYFAVPMRLLWENWQQFQGEQKNPDDTTDFRIPKMTSPAGGYLEESLEDCMGLPTKVANLTHSAMFHRACHLIWNEFFRDQDLQNRLVEHTGDGPDDPADYKIANLVRNKRKDMFTSARPWPQKGEAVTIGLGTYAPVISAADAVPPQGATSPTFQTQTGGSIATLWAGQNQDSGNGLVVTHGNSPTDTNEPLEWQNPNLVADLQNATAATINELRTAFQVQRVLERDARGGTRYAEILASHFGLPIGVIDARLQRPEYLGGASVPLNVTQVPYQAAISGQVGDLGAFGETLNAGGGFTKTCTEHMILIGFVSVRSDLTYQAGLDRMWSRDTRYDFFLPSLAHLGEQDIKNKEIFAQGTPQDDEPFGYCERWAEYKFRHSRLSGLLRSNANQPLDMWHLAQQFENLPVLDSQFITENPPVDRVVAATTQAQFIMEAAFMVRAARPMPVYSTPGMIDHF